VDRAKLSLALAKAGLLAAASHRMHPNSAYSGHSSSINYEPLKETKEKDEKDET